MRYKIYVDSRCRDWNAHTNGNRFSVDLRRPLSGVSRVDVIQATIPAYSSPFWQEEKKIAAIRITGLYRRDVQQTLPTQLPSDVVAELPLATAFPFAVAYTFYLQTRDSGLWCTPKDSGLSVARIDRLEISLLNSDGSPYPTTDLSFAVDQNWSMVLEIECSGKVDR